MNPKKPEISQKDPELYVDGQKVKFHYSREERLAKQPYKKLGKSNSLLDRKNRSLLIVIIDLVLLVFLIMVFIKPFRGQNEEFFNAGFRYRITSKILIKSKQVSFTFEIKNISPQDNRLTRQIFKMLVINEQKTVIYQYDINVAKTVYKSDEFYQENMITDELKKGKYLAEVFLGTDQEKKITKPIIIK